MKYLALILFCLWVLSHVLGAQEVSERKGFADRLVEAARHRLTRTVRYDPAYVVLDYPGGDVPADTGVCTDEVIRAYRALGIDLQRLVHEDMKSAFAAYPKLWGMRRPDKNIDHRRVPNLETFFRRQGAEVKGPGKGRFLPGDLVTWDLNGKGLWHIGMVVAEDTFVHNIGSGPELTEGIERWEVLGHFRFHPQE
jgi:uncharacterized protein YijF (DUF1287 family)